MFCKHKTVRRVLLSITLLLLLCIPLSVSAHSGGTDAIGGHNNSVTGEYHYHHGHPAHQHTNGVCPYQNNNRSIWIVLSVILGFPVVVLVALKIIIARYEAKRKAEDAKLPDFEVYFSIFGDRYHSTKTCIALRNTKVICNATKTENTDEMRKRGACPRCCRWKDGKVYPRDQLK